MRRRWVVIALALPLVVLSASMLQSELAQRTGSEWRFAIQGYDPRDLLRGHYLQFTVAFDRGEAHGACNDGELCCDCLESKGTDVPPRLHRVACRRAAAECADFLEEGALEGAQRFYVPESKAKSLEAQLREAAGKDQAHVVIAVSKKGRAAIKDLLINGTSVSALE